jgi:hypothetical protein
MPVLVMAFLNSCFLRYMHQQATRPETLGYFLSLSMKFSILMHFALCMDGLIVRARVRLRIGVTYKVLPWRTLRWACSRGLLKRYHLKLMHFLTFAVFLARKVSGMVRPCPTTLF